MAAPKTKKTSTTLKDDLVIPSAQEALDCSKELFLLLSQPYLFPFIARLKNLSKNPPQVILFDGGTLEIRLAFVKYWACLLNCKSADAPCGECDHCLKIINELVEDFFLLNGHIESIKVEPLREVIIPLIAQAPSELGYRVVAFYEANAFSTPAAANTMLKSLEEPNKTTYFIMTVAQKELLLPTLISRSFLFSLPINIDNEMSQEEIDIALALTVFFSKGIGFFDDYSARKGFSANEARLIMHVLMSAITDSYKSAAMQKKSNQKLVDYFKNRLNDNLTLTITDYLQQSQEMVQNSSAPNCPLIIDALLVQIYMLLNSENV